jgi:hypothetical protein
MSRPVTEMTNVRTATTAHQTYDVWALVFTEETKREAFEKIVSVAKEKSASAIITVAQASFGQRASDVQTLRDCIFVTVSGLGIETVTLRLPYKASRWFKKISFAELERKTQQGGVAFLAGWPE